MTTEREAELLKAVAHPLRLELLKGLSQGEECVCHLSFMLAKPQPYVSKHLAALREAGLVLDRRDGQRVFYRLASPRVRVLVEAALALFGESLPERREDLVGCPCPLCTGA
jgi:ArsR family transcriptional regulator, arsenate/arsenite/antimonite-responsive transcriptional repressor